MTRNELIRALSAGSAEVERAPALYIAPAVIAGLAVGGALVKGLGSKRPKFRGYKPSRGILQSYEARQKRDIESLYTGRPYESPELGFSPQEMEARYGAATQELEAARRGGLQSISDRYRAGTAAGMLTGAHYRDIQRAETGHLGRISEIRRRNVSEDALQRRRDWMARHGLLTEAYQYGTNLYNQYAKGRYAADLSKAQAKAQFYEGLGGAIAGIGPAMGGSTGIQDVFRRHY